MTKTRRKTLIADTLTDEQKRQAAEAMVLLFAASKRIDKDGDPVAHTIKQVRQHFDTLKMFRKATGLDVSFALVIDELISARRLHVINGFVLVRDMYAPDPQFIVKPID